MSAAPRNLDPAKAVPELALPGPGRSFLIRDAPLRRAVEMRAIAPLAFVAAIVLGAFLLAPGSLFTKIHLALHGVCGQRPSHSLQLGGVPLPLDARMTGLYTGSAVAALWLIGSGWTRAGLRWSWPAIVILAAFVVVLVGDGLNALLFDFGLPHPYPPSNPLRLTTGILAGTSLGVVLTGLFARSVWPQGGCAGQSARRVGEIVPPLLISTAFGALAVSGLPILHGPMAIGLLLAVIGVFTLLGLTLFSLTTLRDGAPSSWSDMAPLATMALVAALAVIGALAGLRLLMERMAGLPPLT